MNSLAIFSVQNDILSVEGKIQFDTVTTLYGQSVKLFASMSQIIVDLQHLEHCDSSGLALCTAWFRLATAQHKQISFINVPAFMKDLIRVYGLDSVLSVHTIP